MLIDRAIKLDTEEIKPAELHSVSAQPTAMWQKQNDWQNWQINNNYNILKYNGIQLHKSKIVPVMLRYLHRYFKQNYLMATTPSN